MVLKHLACAPALLLASGCAFVGPIVDRGYREAPYSACAELEDAQAAATSVGQQPVKVGCFDIAARTKSSYGAAAKAEQALSPAGLIVTDNVSFSLNASEGCKGVFTNFIIEYVAPRGGGADLLATNLLGMPVGMERIEAEASPKLRRSVMREMGDPVKDPAVLEFSGVQGELVVRSVCLKGY